MKINTLTVKLRFVDSKVRELERPDTKQQEAILKHINGAMEKYGAHIIDIEVKASKEDENE